MGDMFFQISRVGSEGKKLCTLLKKRNPIIEGLRTWELQGPRVEVSPGEACSLGEAVTSLVAEEKIRLHCKGSLRK